MIRPARFQHQSLAQRVVFGDGAVADLPAEAARFGARRALLLCTPGQRPDADRLAERLGDSCAGVFDGASMHVPVAIAREARLVARRLQADCVVAFGGGSTIGLGKAIALDSELPVLAVPTTYAGSEMTTIYGLTDAGVKTTGRDARVLPRTVIYDPELTTTLPIALSVTSGLNAIAHAAEALYAPQGNPLLDVLAEEGIAAMARSLPALVAAQGLEDAREARRDALYGAWLCGSVLAQAGVALHHKLCHVLGGSFDLPHAETHAIVLPHALAYNAAAAPHAMQRIARALNAQDAPQALFDLARDNGAPIALKSIGIRASDLDRACELALAQPYPNPRPLQARAIRQLLQDAYEGRRPDPGIHHPGKEIHPWSNVSTSSRLRPTRSRP
jgi:alcohol dehydrogenase class IV